MKRRKSSILLVGLFLVSSIIPIFSPYLSQQAHAISYLRVALNPTPSGSFTITATRQQSMGVTDTVSFNQVNGRWISGPISSVGGVCQSNTPQNTTANIRRNTFDITVRDSSGSTLGTGSHNFCNETGDQVDDVSISTHAPQSGLMGYIHGTFSYVSDTDPTRNDLRFGSSATVTVRGSAGSYNVRLNNNGQIVSTNGITIMNLPDGSYTLSGSYTPPNAENGARTRFLTSRTFTITHNNGVDLSQRVSGQLQGNPTSPAGSTTPECSGGYGIGWIFCGLFNGMASFSDWMLTNLIQPLLASAPVDTDPNHPVYKIWSSFRVYGNIILIIALLVIVLGQTIGIGIVDPYVAKKAAPRIGIAAILVNMSIYGFAAGVDLSNIIGGGIGQLITAPIGGNGLFHFSLNFSQAAGTTGVIFTGGSITAFMTAALFTGGAAGAVLFEGAVFVAIGIVLPALLALLATFATLVAITGLKMGLTIFSPVFLALYAMPGTAKYAKKGLELTAGSLLVWPAVAAIFALSDVMSYIIMQANSIGGTSILSSTAIAASQVVAALVAFAFQIFPLVFIPAIVRAIFGLAGKFYELVNGNMQKAGQKIGQKRKDIARQNLGDYRLQGKDKMYNKLGERASRLPEGSRRRGMYNFTRRVVGGYDHELAMSEYRKREQEKADLTKGYGKDSEFRGLTVDKASALAGAGDESTWTLSSDGKFIVGANGQVQREVRRNAAGQIVGYGKRQFKTFGGSWQNESDVDLAHARWGSNHAMFQAATAYEITKAATQEQVDNIVANYGRVAKGMGLTTDQANTIWIGAAYANQHSKVEMKHMSLGDDWQQTGRLKLNTLGMAREIDELRGNYNMSQMGADVWVTLQQGVLKSRETVQNLEERLRSGQELSGAEQQQLTESREFLQRAARIAKQSVQPSYMGGGGAQYGQGGEIIGVQPPTPVAPPAAAGAPAGPTDLPEGTVAQIPQQRMPYTSTSSGAAGRAAEQHERFVHMALGDEVQSNIHLTNYTPEPAISEDRTLPEDRRAAVLNAPTYRPDPTRPEGRVTPDLERRLDNETRNQPPTQVPHV